jgi:predicted nucleotidyltransferase
MDKKEEIIKRLRKYFDKNASLYGLEMVFLYGSWARGFPRNDSDIDIAIVFSEEPSTDDEYFKRITDISLSLSAELNREVNVIKIYEDFRKPMLYYNAIVSGLPVFIKDFVKYVNFKNEAIYQMEDFCIFGMDWQHEVATKNLEALRHA